MLVPICRGWANRLTNLHMWSNTVAGLQPLNHMLLSATIFAIDGASSCKHPYSLHSNGYCSVIGFLSNHAHHTTLMLLLPVICIKCCWRTRLKWKNQSLSLRRQFAPYYFYRSPFLPPPCDCAHSDVAYTVTSILHHSAFRWLISAWWAIQLKVFRTSAAMCAFSSQRSH